MANLTVCTFSFNSTNEAAIFKTHLSKEFGPKVRFEEFVDSSLQEEEILPNACSRLKAAHEKCDITLFSGHFGGGFFGKSGTELSAQTLESSSCSAKEDSCDNTLFQPKEVYLFGCNTLASKQKDSRTQSQYEAALIKDGFAPDVARTTALFRYAAFGDEMRNRMANVFSKTRFIYGFDSIAPSGATVTPFLEKFFHSISSYESNLRISWSAGKNIALANALSGTAFTQVQGVDYLSESESSVHKNFCAATDPQSALSALLPQSGKNLTGLPQLLDLAAYKQVDEKELQSALRSERGIRIKSDVGNLAMQFADFMPLELKFKRLQLAAGWITDQEYSNYLQNQILRLYRMSSENLGSDLYHLMSAIEDFLPAGTSATPELRSTDFSRSNDFDHQRLAAIAIGKFLKDREQFKKFFVFMGGQPPTQKVLEYNLDFYGRALVEIYRDDQCDSRTKYIHELAALLASTYNYESLTEFASSLKPACTGKLELEKAIR